MDTKEYPSIKDERFQHHQQAPLEDPRALQAKVDDILRHAGEDDPAKAVEALIPHLTPAQHRKLIFKLDCTVLPICWLLYFVNCLDRASIGNAGAYGFRQDVGAAGNTFNIGVTIFYVAYVAVEVPSNLAMKKVGATIWLPAAAIMYGVITLATAFINTRAEFLTIRFLLGVFEGATLPACAYFLSLWYSREQFSSRFGIFITGGSIASGCASLLATAYNGIGEISGQVYGWRNIFFINGILSFAVAIFAFFTLPKNPVSFKILTNPERAYLMGQSALLTAGSMKEEGTKKILVARGFKNASAWFGILPWFCGQILSGSINYFLPEIFRSFGWSGNKANVNTSALFFVASGWVVILACASHYTRHHAGYIVLNLLVGIIGFSMFAYADGNTVRYAGSFLCVMSLYGGVGINSSWVAANAQPYTTRSVALAIAISFGALGGIVGSWVFIASEAERRYPTGVALVYTFNCLAVVNVVAHWVYCKWENKQRDLGKRNWRLDAPAEEVALLGNLHPAFRYAT